MHHTVRGTYGTPGALRTLYSSDSPGPSCCPAPQVRMRPKRLVRVVRKYSTEAPGRTCQHGREAFCSSSVRGSGLISRTAAVAEVDTTLMLPASKAAEIEMAVEKAVPTTPESMLTGTWPVSRLMKRRECMRR